MNLLATIALIGLVAGLVRAKIRGRRLTPPNFKYWWLILPFGLATPLVFKWRYTAELVPDSAARIILLCTLVVMWWFAWSNRQLPGFKIALIGISLNLLVIAANGGFMPIRPEAVQVLYPNAAPGSWSVGHRLGLGKDIVLLKEQTLLWFLSDYTLTPANWSTRGAFSLGDVFLVAGVLYFLWNVGFWEQSISPTKHKVNNEKPTS